MINTEKESGSINNNDILNNSVSSNHSNNSSNYNINISNNNSSSNSGSLIVGWTDIISIDVMHSDSLKIFNNIFSSSSFRAFEFQISKLQVNSTSFYSRIIFNCFSLFPS